MVLFCFFFLFCFVFVFLIYIECQNYQVLNSGDRKVTNDNTPLLCDETLGPAWFRFQGDAGTKMPTFCVPSRKCGTDATGWLNGAHPQEHEGKVTRQVCFNWDSNCCYFSVNIQVQNCSGYYLYYIDGTYPERPCYLRFCGTDWKGTGHYQSSFGKKLVANIRLRFNPSWRVILKEVVFVVFVFLIKRIAFLR